MRYKDYVDPFGRPLKPLSGPFVDHEAGLREVLIKFKEVRIAYLFGSHAKGVVRKTSDVDIAVVAPAIELERYKKLWLAVREVLSTERFDLVILDGKPISFRFEVVKEGRPIYTVDEDSLNDFELRTIKGYLDTKPLRSLYAKILQEQLSGL